MDSITSYISRQVRVNSVCIGGRKPVCIQSMTNTPTHHVQETVAQIKQLADAGCQLVRVTVQGRREALACKEIKKTLIEDGYRVPIAADIHFYPPAALLVAEFVDKVRINPGNFLDKRATFKKLEYSDSEYELELKKIFEGFSPLVKKCKELNKVIRIGVNHGSLSDRIMNRFGDSPEGMCESALEYLRICVKLDFYDVVVSMKSSNVSVMIRAYRLLVEKMQKEQMQFPLHLGVTEAGLDLAGRVKSASGIGTLLLEGIGDTIRVSLTEDPIDEIGPAKCIAQLKTDLRVPIFSYPARKIEHPLLDSKKTVFVEVDQEQELIDLGYKKQLNRWMRPKMAPDLVFFKGFEDLNDPQFLVTNLPCKIPIETKIIIFKVDQDHAQKVRLFRHWLQECNIQLPLLVSFEFKTSSIYEVCAHVAGLLVDHVIDGFSLKMHLPIQERLDLSFMLLQAAGQRLTSLELIACPGCGRTLFNLQEVTRRIRKKTEHLVGVKIAVMGCIVNGPGEMADADFGYVGSGKGKIDLYKGRVCVQKGIDQAVADEQLLALIEQETSKSFLTTS